VVTRRVALAFATALSACGARTNLADVGVDGAGGSAGRSSGGGNAGKGGGNAGKGGGNAGKGGTAPTTGGSAGMANVCPASSLELQLIGYEGLTLDAQDSVKVWKDTRSQYDAIQESESARPSAFTHSLNNRGVLHFDGQDDSLVLLDGFTDYTSGFSAFVVAQPEATEPIHAARFFDLSTAYGTLKDSILFVRFDIGGRDLFYQTYLESTPGPYVSADNAVVDDEWHIFGVVVQCGPQASLQSGRLYRDGEEVAVADVYVPRILTRSSNFIARSNLAQDSYFKGSIAEIQIWQGALTAEQRLATEQDLRMRWGL
jgi:Concanavalin A-like lectin/glucanases superfamily